jgi:hypothetical protein
MCQHGVTHYGATGFKSSTLAIIWNKHRRGLSAFCGNRRESLLIVHYFMVFVYMQNLPSRSNWGGSMASVRRGYRKVYKKDRFWRNARRIVTYLAEHIDELDLNARDDPYNHGTGEMSVGVKEIVDTFPMKILTRNTDHQNSKYGCFVIKFQIMCTLLGFITRLSRAYAGRCADARIFDFEHDGAGHLILGDKAYIGSYRCLTAKKGRQPYLQRLRQKHMNRTRVRIEHMIGFVKSHGLFRRPKDWTKATLPFAAQLVKIVTHCKNIELKDKGGRYPRIGPWAH